MMETWLDRCCAHLNECVTFSFFVTLLSFNCNKLAGFFAIQSREWNVYYYVYEVHKYTIWCSETPRRSQQFTSCQWKIKQTKRMAKNIENKINFTCHGSCANNIQVVSFFLSLFLQLNCSSLGHLFLVFAADILRNCQNKRIIFFQTIVMGRKISCHFYVTFGFCDISHNNIPSKWTSRFTKWIMNKII